MTKEELESLKLQSEIDKNKAEEEKAKSEARYFEKQINDVWYSGRSLKVMISSAITALTLGGLLYAFTIRPITTIKADLAEINTFLAQAKLDSLYIARKEIAKTIDAMTELIVRNAYKIDEADSVGFAKALRVYKMIKGENYYDKRVNPTGTGIENDFQFQSGDSVVYDDKNELTWQQSGSSSYMTFEKAQAYIEEKNRENWGGFTDWRLPTLKEAMSLVEPAKNEANGLYVDRVFDEKHQGIWTSDRMTASSAWGVNFLNGYCSISRFVFDSYVVRAVR